MTDRADSKRDWPSPDIDWPADFKTQYRFTLDQFRRKHGHEKDPMKILSLSSTAPSRDAWEIFLVAYPAAALAMKRLVQFFRDPEKHYRPLEEDETTGELIPRSEAESDQLANPIQYFERGRHPDYDRLEEWNTLVHGDVGSHAWIWRYGTAKYTTGPSEERAKLQINLRKEMEEVAKPWPAAIKNAVEEIERRFEEMEQYLAYLDGLHQVRVEHQENSQQTCRSQSGFTHRSVLDDN